MFIASEKVEIKLRRTAKVTNFLRKEICQKDKLINGTNYPKILTLVFVILANISC